jgi:hypothetical protein
MGSNTQKQQASAGGEGIIGAISSIAAGNAAKREAYFQAAIAKNNAQIAKNNAVLALEQGQVAETAVRLKGSKNVAAAQTGYAAAGIDIGSGSAVAVQTALEEESELDAVTTRYNAGIEAQNKRLQAKGYETSARLLKMQGKAARVAGFIGAAQAIQNAAAKAATAGAGGGA